MESSEEINIQFEKTFKPLFTELAVLIALKKIGERKGLTLSQQIDFSIPWGNAPQSEEEEAHQNLVWIHKVLPPNDKFDVEKARNGFYKKFRSDLLEEFWSKHKFENVSRRSYPQAGKSLIGKTRKVKPPIRRYKKEVNHDL